MIYKVLRLKTIFFLLTATSVVGSQSANAAHYQFTLSGFGGIAGGGRINGFFEAEDVATHNGRGDSQPIPDSTIYSCPIPIYGCWEYDKDYRYNDMVKAFSISFSGNPLFDELNQ